MTEQKISVVIGASPNPSRYAYMATQRLRSHGHEVAAVGLRAGKIGDVEIETELHPIENVDTVTLYVGPKHQNHWEEYILSLNPRRVIFNPGTENSEFANVLRQQDIETLEACTLVMLSIGSY